MDLMKGDHWIPPDSYVRNLLKYIFDSPKITGFRLILLFSGGVAV